MSMGDDTLYPSNHSPHNLTYKQRNTRTEWTDSLNWVLYNSNKKQQLLSSAPLLTRIGNKMHCKILLWHLSLNTDNSPNQAYIHAYQCTLHVQYQLSSWLSQLLLTQTHNGKQVGYTAREESHEVLVYLKIRLLCLESAYSFSHTPPAKIKVKLKGTKISTYKRWILSKAPLWHSCGIIVKHVRAHFISRLNSCSIDRGTT